MAESFGGEVQFVYMSLVIEDALALAYDVKIDSESDRSFYIDNDGTAYAYNYKG